jgi:GNAT superfamily N-acetyltransferase
MPLSISASGRDFLLYQPQTDNEFEAIIKLNVAVHGDIIEPLCRTLDKHLPGMQRNYWYAICAPGSDEVLSTLCLIPSHWTLGCGTTQVRLPVAEMGIVATAEHARGLGLSSLLIHQFLRDAKKAGFLMASIEGIPYFYHRFGFEYAVPLMVKQQLPLELCQSLIKPTEQSAFSLRRWQPADSDRIKSDFLAASAHHQLTMERSTDHWDYLLGPAADSPETFVERHVLLDAAGRYTGYIGIQKDCFGPTLAIAEASVPVALSADGVPKASWLLQAAELLRQHYQLPHISLLLPESHPLSVYTAELAGKTPSAYGWQMQILDALPCLQAMVPVIEARLASSGYAGCVRQLTLNLYKGTLHFDWNGSRLCIAGTASPADGPSLPPELLGPLVLGYRSCAELALCRLDVCIGDDDRDFLGTLFPKLDAFIYPYF